VTKPKCAVCGSKRQRNLIFFPHYRAKDSEGLNPGWFEGITNVFKDILPFKYVMWDEDEKRYEGDYYCVRCLMFPESVSNIKDDNLFDNERFGLAKKAFYRYRDVDEIKAAVRYRKEHE